jgi:hypothetical protein
MPTALMRSRMHNFSEPLREAGRAKNFREQQKRAARVFVFRDHQKTATKLWIGGKLFGAGVQPGIDLGVDGAQRGLQLRRVTFRIVHQKAGIDAEETRQQSARAVREVWPRAALDLREVGLAEAAAHLLLHGLGQFLLRHRTAQTTQGTFYGAERTEFVAESHGGTHLLQSANNVLLFAICVKDYICPTFSSLREVQRLPTRLPSASFIPSASEGMLRPYKGGFVSDELLA